ncbi:hypothetical protein [Ferrimonas balearica]|uniref:hypothetical protein n=1 Tax=Ferrimonas balearica TaxID=44012 RepID=UPI001C9A0CC9|nr:hypothetical protein [Ferrimonas balearica]MBY5990625.1 hypothetical protein [Ferrimonas balearica]
MASNDGQTLLRLANRLGSLGIIMLVLPSLLASLVYVGEAGEAFNFLNHSLSELGRYDSSPLALLVNGGLFFGGLFLVVSFTSRGWLRRRRPIKLSLNLSGVLMSLSVAACGLFPVNVGMVHAWAMTAFYVMTPICAVLYCFAILTEIPPRWGVIPALAAAGCAIALLMRPDRLLALMDRYPYGLFGADRPLIWWPALLGWMLLGFVAIWLLYALVLVKRRNA